MKNFIALFLIFMFVTSQGLSQHEINIEIKNYQNDTLVIGYYLGEKTLVHDSLAINPMGNFVMKGEDKLEQGVYMLLTQPDNEFYQFLIGEDQEFEIKAINGELDKMKFKGSKENELFSEYLLFVSAKRHEADPLRAFIAKADTLGIDASSQRIELAQIDEDVKIKQNEIIKKNPDLLVTKLIKANIPVDIPEFEGSDEEINNKRYIYYKRHFFDNIELANPITLRTPYIHNKINTYIDRLTPVNPDSINIALDSILKWVSPAPETFRYYLSHFINTYANAKVVGLDAVFLHLADNYYARGKADWIDEETLNKIKDNAEKIRPTLIGKTAPNIKVYQEDGSPIAIDDIDYEYLVLLFWAPDCGHCKKVMPDVVEFERNYREKGVKVLAICTKHQEKTKDCWEFLDEKDMRDFINTADEFHKSRFKIKFNVSKTPKMYILDKNREILIKDIGAQHLGEILDQIIELKEQEGEN